MVFFDKNGQEFVTITELFNRKKFLKATNNYFLFFDYDTCKKETWTFTENLVNYIPFETDGEKIKEILSNCGWCKKVNKKDIN